MAMVYHISGFRLAQARKACRFFFGDFYISCDLNPVDRVFDIRLNKTLKIKKGVNITEEKIEDYIDIDGFKKFWGPQWRLMIYNEAEVI